MGRPAQFFFTKKQIEEQAPLNVEANLGPECKKCGMYVGLRHPKCDYTGLGGKKCLIVAEAMGPDEDYVGEQLVGQVGQYFREKLDTYNLDLNRDFWKMNAVNCFPRDEWGNIRAPTRTEMKCCRPMIDKAIETLKPNFIWLLGGKAVESFYMDHFSNLTITRWRKLCIPDRETGAYIIPLYHPSFPRRKDTDENLQAVYDADLKWAISCLRRKRHTWESESKHIHLLYNLDEILEKLDWVLTNEPKFFYIDYETNCLKPQWPGSKIATCAFCVQDEAYSFPFQYRGHWSPDELRSIKRLWRKILTNKNIGKLAHNMKFEHNWSKHIMGVDTENWLFDTMVFAHIQDCRNKYTSLNFQTYINFGVLPYDKFIRKYLHSRGGDPFNKIDDAPLGDLLDYNARDTKYGMKLYYKQLDDSLKLSPGLRPMNKFAQVYNFFHQGILVLADIQQTGIAINEEYFYSKFLDMGEELKELKSSLLTGEEAEQFKTKTGKPLDIDSPKDLGVLFYDVLGEEPVYTDKENYQVDKEALRRIKSPFVKKLLTFRRKDKIRNTYLAQFVREACNGKMYPFFDLHIPITYRGSSSNPNFQNIPVRDEEAKKICRSGIIPSPGNQILEVDFKGIEVSMAACYTFDPTLIADVSDPDADMHRDTAGDIWILDVDRVSKMVRFYAKNGWVFPEFYGSFYGNCAKNLWENVVIGGETTNDGYLIRDHMRDQGIRTLEDFTYHCEAVEDIFWNERFKVYKEWKDTTQVAFQKAGYIETYMGFRYEGYLTYNEVSNYPIQGTAFHCLLWTLIEVYKVAKREKWRSKIIGQIHDSIVFDLYPPELDHILEVVRDIGTRQIKEKFDWIIVPLVIDAEVTPIDGSWYEKKEIK